MKSLYQNEFNKNKYGWSKYGGNNLALPVNKYGEVQDNLGEWYCQACGGHQTDEMPCFMFEVVPGSRDFIKICTLCQHKKVTVKVEIYTELIEVVRG